MCDIVLWTQDEEGNEREPVLPRILGGFTEGSVVADCGSVLLEDPVLCRQRSDPMVPETQTPGGPLSHARCPKLRLEDLSCTVPSVPERRAGAHMFDVRCPHSARGQGTWVNVSSRPISYPCRLVVW